MKSSRQHPSHKISLADWLTPLFAILGLYWFSTSFFLAKRSLPHSATCAEASLLLTDVLKLNDIEASRILEANVGDKNNGCWLPRRVDSMVILVVDALRFDFAQYNLPLSIGARIEKKQNSSSQLLQFVADPPTVTMQRLKGLTTGSLPTFADISGNFGGSTIDEDSWVQQLKDTNYKSRGLKSPSKLGFVGDDTWVDLFPTQFEESYPLPSFNTRDLDTVDNGCLQKLPQLLKNLRMKDSNSEDDLEVIVSHFLGVDHVGHTYGPHNEQMDAKLRQMDAALSTTLDILDESNSCHLALIFGDHGMTEDGNHGGGSDEEVNAALFVHFSPACHVDDDSMSLQSASRIMGSKYVHEIFQSIHQIDLVPTISVLLGLPIPYQNLGGIVPSLLASKDIRHTAAALALNAAQVWRYFTIYSETANKLPNLPELQERLNDATAVYREALQHHDDANDSNAFYKACGLFKIFLAEASELGHRVWTRFDTVGMAVGGVILLLVLLISIRLLKIETGGILMFPKRQILETALSILFIVFQSAMLSFSNSYIAAEQEIVMFMMTVLGGSIYIRFHDTIAGGNAKILPYVPLLLPVLSRLGEVIVSGHGSDPSIRLHAAHSPLLFIPSLVCLLAMRIQVYRKIEAISANKSGAIHAAMDCLSLLLLASSWLEKRSSDTTRNGYLSARLVLMALVVSLPVSIAEALVKSKMGTKAYPPQASPVSALSHVLAIVSKLLIAMMLVTGPATASSVLIVSTQGWMLHILSGATGFYEVSVPIQAVLWRFVVRHVFFATNHGCAFNRLHYAAAFVATIEFDFVLGGLQLFLNTFGWEIIGMCAVCLTSFVHKKPAIWRWFCFFQLLESFLNCISVSLLRRHLMVWAVYAPRFLFSSIFLVMNCLGQFINMFALS